jgi:chromosome segregation ATPase
MADPDPSRPDLLLRAEQAQAQSHTLREQVAELAEAVAQVELDVARVHEGIAEQGGSLAAQAREHAERAREFAAREHAEAERLRRVGRAEDRWPERANSASKSRRSSSSPLLC